MNSCPIIGILCMDYSEKLKKIYGDNYKSYIAASYVKFLEGAGARVVPIWTGKDEEYYKYILSHINGVVFPGGATWLTEKDGYGEAGRIIYNIALKINEDGEYFPILGICLGYELLIYASGNGADFRQDCDSFKLVIPLKLEPDFNESKIFKNAPNDIIHILQNDPVTYNYHRYCITKEDLLNSIIKDEWCIIAINSDKNGLEHISIMEHKRYPFYGVQFHPEKNAYEFSNSQPIPHSIKSIKVSQYFAEFFVSETRKNKNSFCTTEETDRHLIYNFPKTFTGRQGAPWQECYIFPENVDY